MGPEKSEPKSSFKTKAGALTFAGLSVVSPQVRHAEMAAVEGVVHEVGAVMTTPVNAESAKSEPVAAPENPRELLREDNPDFYKLRPEQRAQIDSDTSLTPEKRKFLGDTIVAAEIVGRTNPDVNLGVMVAQAQVETEWGTKQMMFKNDAGEWTPTNNILGIKGGKNYHGHQRKFDTRERNEETGQYYHILASFRVYDRFDTTKDEFATIKNMVDCMNDYVQVIDQNPSFADAREHAMEPHKYVQGLENRRPGLINPETGQIELQQQYATAGTDYVSAIDGVLREHDILDMMDRYSRTDISPTEMP